MGCPFHSDDEQEPPGDEGERTRTESREGTSGSDTAHGWSAGSIDRRAFLKSAVAIGGTAALAAVLGGQGGADDGSDVASLPYPTGDPSARPEMQFLWSPVVVRDVLGNPTPPRHQLVLLLDYVGDDREADAAELEAALRQLESAFAYDQREGLLSKVGYSPAYFKRHSTGPPTGVEITEPRAVSPHNDPAMDRQDVFVQLASDEAAIVLAAEEALKGTVDEVNGVSIDASVDGILETDERRPVFAGPGLPKERIDDESVAERIDERAPLSMGYDSVFSGSIPTEDTVSIPDGPWAGGTVAMVSKLRLDLADWYENRTEEERVDEMFAPQFTTEDVGEFGEGLGEGSARKPGEDWEDEEEHLTARTEADAREKGVVGHSQKLTRARDDDFEVTLVRRDGNITIDDGKGGLSFVGLVRRIDDWFEMAETMYDTDLDETLREHDGTDEATGEPDGHHPRSGIASSIDVRARGHFLVPPRSLRALPPASP
jgi:hypothetical protein